MTPTPPKYTVVQHSAFGYGGKDADPQFEKGLEVRSVTRKKEQDAVVKAGGLLFSDYMDADTFCDEEMYPRHVTGLIPDAPGTFSDVEVDGLKVYVPAQDPTITRIDNTGPENLPEKDPGEFTYGDQPYHIAHDNYRRATFAAVAVKRFAETTGLASGGEDNETAIGDLLGDLMHLCDSLGISWQLMVSKGDMHYSAERQGHWG